LRPDVHIVLMPNTIHDIPLQRPARLAEEIDNARRGQVETTST
jgi:hypothetical protein